MIRPFTLIAMLLAALSGAYLFAVKHRAQVLDDQIAALSQSSRLDAMRIRVLQGQWSLETDPIRLQQLAAQFTTLQPMQPAQLITLAALRGSLPPPGSAAPASNPALPAQAVPQMAMPQLTAQNSTAPGALPLPPPPAPMMLASLAPAQPALARPASARPVQARPAEARIAENRVVAHRVSHSSLHLANTELAETLPPPKPYYAPRPRPVEQVAQSSLAGQTVPMGAQVMSVKATGMASPDGGSVLGMASNLAPPQPMPQNGSDN